MYDFLLSLFLWWVEFSIFLFSKFFYSMFTSSDLADNDATDDLKERKGCTVMPNVASTAELYTLVVSTL